MNKKKETLSNLFEKEDDSKSRLLQLCNEIPSDVSFALSLFTSLNQHPWHDKDITAAGAKIPRKNQFVTKQDGSCFSENISYAEFCKLFDSIYSEEDGLKISKEIDLSQLSKDAGELNEAINTFFRFISDRICGNDDADEIRTTRMKDMFEENESYKAEIESLMKQMEKMDAEYDEKLQEYESKKKIYEIQLTKAYRDAKSTKSQIEAKNKRNMLMHLKIMENDLDDLEKQLEEKQKLYIVKRDANIVEVDHLKKDLIKKEMLLKITNDRYSNDMLTRYRQKKNLQQIIKDKENSYQQLKEDFASMEIYHDELEEYEKDYLKRELYDKLERVRQKIALRAITKFLMPYVIKRFGPRYKAKKKKAKK